METIGRICPMCGTINTIEIDDKAAKALKEYKNGNGYIQDIQLPAAEREFIKTGFCIPCQEILFAPPEDEEDDE